jgi:hypothetical protein
MAVFTAKDKIQEIKDKSANALSIFRKTVSDLNGVNTSIQTEIKDRESKIVVLKDECTILNEVQAENTQFITKINEFLGTPKS